MILLPRDIAADELRSSHESNSLCDMHKEMMSGKTPGQRQAMMAKHMKAMSPQMQQHMQMMQQQCK